MKAGRCRDPSNGTRSAAVHKDADALEQQDVGREESIRLR